MASWTTAPEAKTGTWVTYRQTPLGVPPLYYGVPGRAPDQASGRWHRQGEGFSQYLALSAMGAWAELVRQLTLRTVGQIESVHRNLWSVQVHGRRIADLATFAKYDACGRDPDIAVDAHSRSQALADELRNSGYDGVLSPSAALPDAQEPNLTLFGPRVEVLVDGLSGTGSANHVGSLDPGLWCSAAWLAYHAAPPASLSLRTRFLGTAHRGLQEWRAKV